LLGFHNEKGLSAELQVKLVGNLFQICRIHSEVQIAHFLTFCYVLEQNQLGKKGI
jgi:hypothetical protein